MDDAGGGNGHLVYGTFSEDFYKAFCEKGLRAFCVWTGNVRFFAAFETFRTRIGWKLMKTGAF
jgi:hypothetical protein